MIDWSKLKPYQNDKRKSFEELCYQIAKKLYGHSGVFTSIDDSGGGDGVEFYMTLPDGSEWGWQAKFYFPQPRLDDSRKRAIENSLTASLAKHKNLAKWFLCTPTNFTNKGKKNELAWFDSTLKSFAPGVLIEHWGDSDLAEMLSNPHMVGKKLYFFGELELTHEWFAQQVGKQIANVHEKFSPGLHTETDIDERAHSLLGDARFVTKLAGCRDNLERQQSQIADAVKSIERYIKEDEWQDSAELFRGHVLQAGVEVESAASALTTCLSHIANGRIAEARRTTVRSHLERLQEQTDKYDEHYYAVADEKIGYAGSPRQEQRDATERTRTILRDMRKPVGILSTTGGEIATAADLLRDFAASDLHVFGTAGIGKTHVTCHLCKERTDGGLPAILLLGNLFSQSSTIEKKALEILDVPASYSWQDFARALESYAEAHNARVLISIDALNEAATIEVWQNELRGFMATLAASPWVSLVTTCRESYRSAIWNDDPPANAVVAHGFDEDNLEPAVERYFEHYKLKADLTLASLDQFKHPLYLKIFCEVQNHERAQEKEVYIGEQTLFDVFEAFLEASNKAVCRRLSKPPTARLLQNALAKCAGALWRQNARHITTNEAVELFDGKTPDDVDWERSLTKALLDEGLLIARDWIGDEDRLSFTYDLLGGYLISRSILDNFDAGGAQEFVRSALFSKRFTGDDYRERHPLHEDILRCLCALLPERTGTHLYMLTDDMVAYSRSVNALFEIKPSLVGSAQIELVERLFAEPRNRKPLLRLLGSTSTNAGHPLNFRFVDRLLTPLTMPERDVSWTEHVRASLGELTSNLARFEKACRDATPFTALGEARAELAAGYFRWLLTSTHHLLRDSATRALYWYGRRFPRKLFAETVRSLVVNDPYVPERMLAASYGVAMALHADPAHDEFRGEVLPRYARELFDKMFAKGAAHGTTHALARDYARHSVEIALLYRPGLLNPAERKRITPPFRDGGVRKWGKSNDRDKGRYSEGNAPVQLDFGNYTLGRLVPGRSNYDDKHRGYRDARANIFWRLYDLGYSLEIFGEIDKELSRLHWNRHEAENGRADRYGKKYAWIAYYELYGFRQDKGLMKSPHQWWSEDGRPTDVDIDPSFPDQPASLRIVNADLLGDRSLDVRDWIERGGQPDLLPHLVMGEIDGEPGPWVLLAGSIRQEDEAAKRRNYVVSLALLMQKQQRDKFLAYLRASDKLMPGWLEVPSDMYTFAGETPWADTFPMEARFDVEFNAGKRRKKVRHKALRLYRNDAPLSEEETNSVLDKIEPEMAKHKDRRRQAEALDEVLKAERVVVRRVQEYREVEEAVTKRIRALMPVRQNLWESYHSPLNPARGAFVSARELAEASGLWIGLPSWDMYDRAGKRATITRVWEPSWSDRQNSIYIRQDLLDQFLRKKRLNLLWVTRGERQLHYKEDEVQRLRNEKFQHYKNYRQISYYDAGTAGVVDSWE